MKAPALFFTTLMIASVHQILSGETSGDWTYTVTDNQATITDYSGAGGEVEIPASVNGMAVVKVGDGWPPVVGAFDYTVTSIIIPDSVTSIGDDAFSYCNNLSSITIPDSVTIIGQDAFRFCSSLTSLTIPNSVTTIGDTVFAWCTSLTNITVDADNLNYSSVDGVLFNKLQTSLITYPAGGSDTYTIPDSVTSIGDDAFTASDLTSITIPDSVTSIGDYAFWYCSGLTSIIIPDSVTSIGAYAFVSCKSLTNITTWIQLTSARG